LPGSTDEAIYVTAHYDKVESGEGAIDNWSGASLLPSLYQTLSKTPRRLTFVFVASCDEEKGLVGSRELLEQLSRQERARIVANFNIDSIGLGPTKIWLSRSHKALARIVAAAARAMKVPLEGMNVEKVGESDSRSFLNKKIPVIDFHSLTPENHHILHSMRDRRSEVVWDAYYDTYRLISASLAYLDGHPELQPARK
jgi:Zn-dependent M28 family amino/carboxypeptidase